MVQSTSCLLSAVMLLTAVCTMGELCSNRSVKQRGKDGVASRPDSSGLAACKLLSLFLSEQADLKTQRLKKVCLES